MKFNEKENETRVLNNIGVCFYLNGDLIAARKFFKLAMKINEQIPHPDEILIYNYFLLEERLTKCDEEVGIKSLFKLKESHERNLFIFLLRLKQNKYFNKFFF